MPFKCPVCGLTYESFGNLTKHVFQLAYWYPHRPTGKGVGARKRHYDWLKDRNITIKYDVVKKYLEGLFPLRPGDSV